MSGDLPPEPDFDFGLPILEPQELGLYPVPSAMLGEMLMEGWAAPCSNDACDSSVHPIIVVKVVATDGAFITFGMTLSQASDIMEMMCKVGNHILASTEFLEEGMSEGGQDEHPQS